MEFESINNENDSIKNSIYSSINNYSQDDLISLINNEKIFFDNININELKLLNNNIFYKISENTLKNLTKEGIENLVKAKKIQYLNKNLLNFIRKDLFHVLSNDFFKQITINQFYSAKKKVIIDLGKIRKIHNFNKTVLKDFYKEYFNSFEDIKVIVYLLAKSGKNFECLTIDDFTYLKKFIGQKDLDFF